jgi:holo-[acyl-carrier protein] synthase
MIENFGIGIDISNTEKFKSKPFNDNESFYRKIFSEEEIEYCLNFKNNYEKFAGKFALKEAVVKSINKEIQFLEIQTSHSISKPTVKILGSEKRYRFLASLSHESEFAVAVVISEKII